MRLYCIARGFTPMSDVATIRALKTDPYKGYNFLAARAGSALLARIAGLCKFRAPGLVRTTT